MLCQKKRDNGMQTAHYRTHAGIVHIHTAIEWAGANNKIGRIILPK